MNLLPALFQPKMLQNESQATNMSTSLVWVHANVTTHFSDNFNKHLMLTKWIFLGTNVTFHLLTHNFLQCISLNVF